MQGVSGSNPLGSIRKTTVTDKVFGGHKTAFLLSGDSLLQHFSLHALGKRNIKEGTKWLLDREPESFDWWLIEDQEQQLPGVRQRLSDRILSHVKQHGYCSIADLTKALAADEEYIRVCCVDLFTQGKLERHPKPSNGPRRRGRPAFVYGVGDFSCIAPTPPLTTVPFIGGEDDPAWGPRQTTGDDGLNFDCVKT